MSNDCQSDGTGSVLCDGSSERASVPWFLSTIRGTSLTLVIFLNVQTSAGANGPSFSKGGKTVRISNLFFNTLILPCHLANTVFLFMCLSLLLRPQEPLLNLRVKQATFRLRKPTKPGQYVLCVKANLWHSCLSRLLTIHPLTTRSNVLRSV